MRVRSICAWLAALVVALGAPGAVLAGNLVSNGDFSQVTGGFGLLAPSVGANTALADWTVDPAVVNSGNWLFDGTNIAAGSNDPNGKVFLWGPPIAPPVPGNILAMDGDTQYRAAISQTIQGLTPGNTYELTFYRSGGQLTAFSGPTETRVQVSFGGDTQTTSTIANASQSWYGSWLQETMTFTASSTSQLLSFLAYGTPDNVPPLALLTGIQLQEVNTPVVPEPSSIVALGIGLVGVGLARRFRGRRS